MPKNVHIRDLDDEVYSALAARAAECDMSVPEFLRREVRRIAMRPSGQEWLERTRRRPGTRPLLDTVAALDEMRGPFPA